MDALSIRKTEVIGQTVAMGLDNDCTTGTAGNIVEAVVGADGMPEHWYRPFSDKARTFSSSAPSACRGTSQPR